MHGRIKDPWEGLRGNLLLQTLPAHDALMIAPWLKRVQLCAGQSLGSPQDASPSVYFPETSVVCLAPAGSDGDGYQVGLIGHEGAVGCEALLGCIGIQQRALVQLAGGTALELSAARLLQLCAANPGMAERISRFVHIFAVQVARTLVSNLRDPLDRRIARWLLMFHDRHATDDLPMTHQALGSLLNVRRASVTDVIHILEGYRMLRCTRGHIVIRDRAALEAHAGHAYGGAEQTYRAAIGPFGKSRSS